MLRNITQVIDLNILYTKIFIMQDIIKHNTIHSPYLVDRSIYEYIDEAIHSHMHLSAISLSNQRQLSAVIIYYHLLLSVIIYYQLLLVLIR